VHQFKGSKSSSCVSTKSVLLLHGLEADGVQVTVSERVFVSNDSDESFSIFSANRVALAVLMSINFVDPSVLCVQEFYSVNPFNTCSDHDLSDGSVVGEREWIKERNFNAADLLECAVGQSESHAVNSVIMEPLHFLDPQLAQCLFTLRTQLSITWPVCNHLLFNTSVHFTILDGFECSLFVEYIFFSLECEGGNIDRFSLCEEGRNIEDLRYLFLHLDRLSFC